MHKEVAYFNDNGEQVYKSHTQFTGRFNDESNTYSFYAHGKTLCSRMTANYPIEVSKLDMANIMLLSKFLQPNTNILSYRTKDGLKPMGVDRIGKVIGTQDRQTRRYLSKMIRAQVMVRQEVERVSIRSYIYILNPIYFLNGKKITTSLYYTFQESLDRELPEWVRKKFLKLGENQ